MKTVQPDTPTVGDSPLQIVDLLLFPARQRLQFGKLGLVLDQPENITRPLNQPGLQKLRHLLSADALDVEGIPSDEMPETLGHLRRTDQPAGAAPDRLPLGTLGQAPADRTHLRKGKRFAILASLGEIHVDHLRDHVARPLDGDGIALADVLGLDVVLIVQRSRGKPRRRRRSPARRLATGVKAPVRPTWMVIFSMIVVACSAANLCAIAQRGARPDEAQPALQIDPVDLEHDPHRYHTPTYDDFLRLACDNRRVRPSSDSVSSAGWSESRRRRAGR